MRKRISSKFFWTLSLFLFSCSDKPTTSTERNSSVTESSSVDTENPPVKEALAANAGKKGEAEDTVQPIPNAGAQAQARIKEILRKANPDYRGQGRFHEEDGDIVAGEFPNCSLRDLSPLRGLKLQMLDLSNNPVREIRHLKGMPLRVLYLENTGVVSLKSLSEARLRELRLNNSPVESLDGLQGQPLENLYAVKTRINDVEPLRKSNLRGLWLTDSPVSDLSPLGGLPLVSLTAHRTLVSDLSFVRKLPVLQRLHIGETLIEDLSPLEGVRLTRLVFTPSRIKRGMDSAKRLQGLTQIGASFDDQRQELMPPAQFWAQFGK